MTDYKLNVGNKAALDLEVDIYPEAKFKLSQLSGKWVIVYFYPKDNTSGCTTESCEFRDALPDFSSAKAEIIGVSRDSLKSHALTYGASGRPNNSRSSGVRMWIAQHSLA